MFSRCLRSVLSFLNDSHDALHNLETTVRSALQKSSSWCSLSPTRSVMAFFRDILPSLSSRLTKTPALFRLRSNDIRSLSPSQVSSSQHVCVCVDGVCECVCRLRVLAELLSRSVFMPKIDGETRCFKVTTRFNLLQKVSLRSLLVCIWCAVDPNTLDST